MNTPARFHLTTKPTRPGRLRHSKPHQAAMLAHKDKYPHLVRSVYAVVPRNLVRDGARPTLSQLQEVVTELLTRKWLPPGSKILGYQVAQFGRELQVSVAVPSHRVFIVPDWLTTPAEDRGPSKFRL